MFFNKIFHFVKGYVIIEVFGTGIERFLYISAKRGLALFNMGRVQGKKLVVCISNNELDKLYKVQSKCSVDIRIVRECGLPYYLKKYKKRYVLILGLAIVSILMFVSSFFIWSVEIISPGGTIPQELYQALDIAGVRIGAFIPKMMGEDDIKNSILDNTDSLSWVWVYKRGTKAVVNYRTRKEIPYVADKKTPCDIVAIKDALIVSVREKNGKALVGEGDTVLAGDTLISGVIERTLGEQTLINKVHAMGEIRAYTWYEKEGVFPLYKTNKIPTGNRKAYYTVKLFSRCFNLFKREKVDYSDYVIKEDTKQLQLGNVSLGIGIYKKEYIEIKQEKVEIPYDDAVLKARAVLEESIAKELLPSSQLQNTTVKSDKADDENVRVSIVMEFIENIGENKIN